MPAKANKKNNVEDVKMKPSRKVIEEDDRLRRKAENEKLREEEEEEINRLEAIRIQKNQKNGRKKQNLDTSHTPLAAGLECEQDVEEKKKKQNKLKCSKKKAKEAARRKQLEQELMNAKKVSSSISIAPLEHNFNHATFFGNEEEDGHEEEYEEEQVEREEQAEDVEGIPNQAEDDENDSYSDEEDIERDHEDNFVIVTRELECVSPVSGSVKRSPASVLVGPDAVPPPPLNIGDAMSLNDEIDPARGFNTKKKGKGKNKPLKHQNKILDEKDKPVTTKKQAKEAAKLAYAAFEAKILPSLKEANPMQRLRDHRAQAAAMWLRSPENPDHPNHALFLAHSQN